MTREARRSELETIEPGHIVAQVANGQLGDTPCIEPFGESAQITGIGFNRVCGQVTFGSQVMIERFEEALGGSILRLTTQRKQFVP